MCTKTGNGWTYFFALCAVGSVMITLALLSETNGLRVHINNQGAQIDGQKRKISGLEDGLEFEKRLGKIMELGSRRSTEIYESNTAKLMKQLDSADVEINRYREEIVGWHASHSNSIVIPLPADSDVKQFVEVMRRLALAAENDFKPAKAVLVEHALFN